MDKETLLATLDTLKVGYIQLINEKDVLENWGKPQLEALYNTRIGIYQVELLQIQLRIQALKRKVELVRSVLARNVEVDLQHIEQLVARELRQVEHQIMNQVDTIARSEDLLQNLASPTRSNDLRKAYREMAKQIHPDIVGDHLTPELEALWQHVQSAYQSGDLEMLQALKITYASVLERAEEKANQLNEDQLSLKIETLKEGIKLLSDTITKIRSHFPFTIEAQIKDEEWVAEEVSKIKADIKEHRAFEGELILEYQIITMHYGDTTEHN